MRSVHQRSRLRSSGFLLVASLMLSTLFLVAGLGLLSAQSSRYAAAARVAEGMQAKNAALSGMEDVRVKLAKDVKFPPRSSKDREQYRFAYSENISEPTADAEISYTVVVDYELEREVVVPATIRWGPYRWGLYRISVSGFYGPRADPVATSVLYAEYDIATAKFIRFEDRSSL